MLHKYCWNRHVGYCNAETVVDQLTVESGDNVWIPLTMSGPPLPLALDDFRGLKSRSTDGTKRPVVRLRGPTLCF